jgi:excisionase family DNA binding protein
MTAISREIKLLKQKAKTFISDLEQIEAIVDSTDAVDSTSPSEIITVEELAKILLVHPNTVRRFINQGLLEPMRIGKKLYFVREQLPEILAAATKARDEKGVNSL